MDLSRRQFLIGGAKAGAAAIVAASVPLSVAAELAQAAPPTTGYYAVSNSGIVLRHVPGDIVRACRTVGADGRRRDWAMKYLRNHFASLNPRILVTDDVDEVSNIVGNLREVHGKHHMRLRSERDAKIYADIDA